MFSKSALALAHADTGTPGGFSIRTFHNFFYRPPCGKGFSPGAEIFFKKPLYTCRELAYTIIANKIKGDEEGKYLLFEGRAARRWPV
jgi:hypothetical protein